MKVSCHPAVHEGYLLDGCTRKELGFRALSGGDS